VDRRIRSGYGSAMEKLTLDDCILSMVMSSRKRKDTAHISINMVIIRGPGNGSVRITGLRLALSEDPEGSVKYVLAGIPENAGSIELRDGVEYPIVWHFFSTDVRRFSRMVRLTVEGEVEANGKKESIKKTILFSRYREFGLFS
jgi:hypothetical protein